MNKNNKTITIKLSAGEYRQLTNIVENGYDNGELIKGYAYDENDQRIIDHHNAYQKIINKAHEAS